MRRSWRECPHCVPSYPLILGNSTAPIIPDKLRLPDFLERNADGKLILWQHCGESDATGQPYWVGHEVFGQ